MSAENGDSPLTTRGMAREISPTKGFSKQATLYGYHICLATWLFKVISSYLQEVGGSF